TKPAISRGFITVARPEGRALRYYVAGVDCTSDFRINRTTSVRRTSTATIRTPQKICGDINIDGDCGAAVCSGPAMTSVAATPVNCGAMSARSYCGGLR